MSRARFVLLVVAPVLLLTVAAAVSAGEAPTGVQVSLLDGTSFSGETLAIDAAKKTVSVGGRSVPLADCDALTLPGADPGTAAKLRVWLGDGGVLPAERIEPASVADAILVVGPLGSIELPLAAVLGWGAEDLRSAAQDQVVLPGDRLSGEVQGIADGKLVVRSLDAALSFPLADVIALRLRGEPRPPRGLHLSAGSLALLPRTPLRLAAAPSAELAPPPGWILRVEGGRRVYLSALDPASVDETGAFGVVWPHARDRNLDGDTIRLGGVRHARGLVVHSQARLTWKLGGAYERLRALAGIGDETAGEGDCGVAILGDGKPLWRKDSVKGRDRPLPLDLPLAGVQVLELTVEFGARYDIGDRFTLADAYLVKSK